MNNIIASLTRIFDFIYVNERVGVPEFRIHHWQDKVLNAIRNPDLPDSDAIIQQELVHRSRRTALNDNFEKIIGVVTNTPEPLRVPMLHVLRGSIETLGSELGLSDLLISDLNSYVSEELAQLGDSPEPQQLQQAGAVLQQILAAQAGTSGAEAVDSDSTTQQESENESQPSESPTQQAEETTGPDAQEPGGDTVAGEGTATDTAGQATATGADAGESAPDDGTGSEENAAASAEGEETDDTTAADDATTDNEPSQE